MRGKAAIPHCDFTLGWLEQSVEVLASISLQTHTRRRRIKKEKKKRQTHEMRYSLRKSHSKQSAPHPLHGIQENISYSWTLHLTWYNHILTFMFLIFTSLQIKCLGLSLSVRACTVDCPYTTYTDNTFSIALRLQFYFAKGDSLKAFFFKFTVWNRKVPFNLFLRVCSFT